MHYHWPLCILYLQFLFFFSCDLHISTPEAAGKNFKLLHCKHNTLLLFNRKRQFQQLFRAGNVTHVENENQLTLRLYVDCVCSERCGSFIKRLLWQLIHSHTHTRAKLDAIVLAPVSLYKSDTTLLTTIERLINRDDIWTSFYSGTGHSMTSCTPLNASSRKLCSIFMLSQFVTAVVARSLCFVRHRKSWMGGVELILPHCVHSTAPHKILSIFI